MSFRFLNLVAAVVLALSFAGAATDAYAHGGHGEVSVAANASPGHAGADGHALPHAADHERVAAMEGHSGTHTGENGFCPCPQCSCSTCHSTALIQPAGLLPPSGESRPLAGLRDPSSKPAAIRITEQPPKSFA